MPDDTPKKPHVEPRKRAFQVEPLPAYEHGSVFSEEHRRLTAERADPLPEHYAPAQRSLKQAHAVRMSLVQMEEVQWLWPGWLAAGKLALLEGKPSLGKSTLALTLAARVSTGTPFPDQPLGERTTPRHVILLSAEDSAGDTLKPRLLEAGADLDNVTLLQGVLHLEDEERRTSMVHLPEDIDVLEQLIMDTHAAMVVVDVLAAYTGMRRGMNVNADNDVRTMLNPLTQMLDRQKVHGLAIRHWTKAGDDDLVMRGGGSVAYAAAARQIYACVQHPENDSLYVLVCAKNNLARKAEPISYSIVEGDTYNTARIAWRGPIDITVQELMRRRREPTADDATEEERCKSFILTALMDGPLLGTSVLSACMDQGFSERTAQRAAADLGVRKVREQQPDGSMRSVWYLDD